MNTCCGGRLSSDGGGSIWPWFGSCVFGGDPNGLTWTFVLVEDGGFTDWDMLDGWKEVRLSLPPFSTTGGVGEELRLSLPKTAVFVYPVLADPGGKMADSAVNLEAGAVSALETLSQP